MSKTILNSISILLFIAVSFISCDNGSSNDSFRTKEDSVKFAKAVYKLYPNEIIGDIKDTSWLPGATNGVHPIPWDTVLAYQNYYDKEPKLYSPQKLPYKGFGVDPKGYSWILANKNIKGLYLRLGRKADGSYTMMLLGTDSTGNILQKTASSTNREGSSGAGEPSNFDNSVPCPANCPDNDN